MNVFWPKALEISLVTNNIYYEKIINAAFCVSYDLVGKRTV